MKFSDFKKIILDQATVFFDNEGFKFIKSKQSFKKILGKNYIEYFFDFLDYSPNWYEYTFGLSVSIYEIEQLKNEFSAYAQGQKFPAYSCFFFQGDFIEELRDSQRKFRSGFYNKVSFLDSIEESLSKTLNLIKSEALPLSYSLCKLNDFQDYYIFNPSKIVKNFGSETLFVSSLFAAYLKSETAYHDLSCVLKAALDIEKNKGSEFSQLYSLLESVNKFINVKIGK